MKRNLEMQLNNLEWFASKAKKEMFSSRLLKTNECCIWSLEFI